jgi:hypothetical protein
MQPDDGGIAQNYIFLYHFNEGEMGIIQKEQRPWNPLDQR